jgi:hypothetical protein
VDGISMNKSRSVQDFKLSAYQGIAEAQFGYGIQLFHEQYFNEQITSCILFKIIGR